MSANLKAGEYKGRYVSTKGGRVKTNMLQHERTKDLVLGYISLYVMKP